LLTEQWVFIPTNNNAVAGCSIGDRKGKNLIQSDQQKHPALAGERDVGLQIVTETQSSVPGAGEDESAGAVEVAVLAGKRIGKHYLT